MEYRQAKRISLKDHSEFDEKWVQEKIAADPSILGLGDLELIDRERRQPKAGVLDLLLRNSDDLSLFEVEIQLGSTDPSHIIRTIEYWDIERRRYPNENHYAILIAEDITSRFLNVVSLFNSHIPILALKLEALAIEDFVTLNFTTVIDELQLPTASLDDDENAPESNRTLWEEGASRESLALTDQIMNIIREFEPDAELRYNRNYIGLTVKRRAKNFVTFRPKKKFVKLEIKIPHSAAVDEQIEASDLDLMTYDKRYQQYRVRINSDDLGPNRDLLRDLIGKAYERREAA